MGLAALLLPVALLLGLTLKSTTLEELVRGSAVIVEGTAGTSHSYWDAEGRKIYTDTNFLISEKYKGGDLPETIVIHQLGGQVGEIGMEIGGVTFLQQGEHLVLCLNRVSGSQGWAIHSMVLGKFYVNREAGQTIVRNAVAGSGAALKPAKNSSPGVDVEFNGMQYTQFIRRLESAIRTTSGNAGTE